ncbi:hypothetical protein LOTGIDRAFT_163589 [Lottia gigantea]|uniref:Conodipine-M alpha chain n=1 Tax=Lottia gigantea TaxID=225164 RepID=V4A7R2_LOTGI|nr:hypothetical protein LOTGIDRAFT_163589 [Lottia gigantea]ESO91065.1 hypothetical protein LOTGIDRAFT_163589 [Lottia gigantea]
MQPSLVFGVCIVVCLVGLLTAQCHRYDVNGCSIPYNLPYFYKQSFTPSCDKHDVCYECGAAKGIPKTTCDIKLYNDIKAVCASHGVGRRDVDKRSLISQFCNLVSVSYYEAVKHFGAGYFSQVSPSWCSESWVRGCLP